MTSLPWQITAIPTDKTPIIPGIEAFQNRKQFKNKEKEKKKKAMT